MQPNHFYHIYNHANGDENLFKEKKNYSFFLEKYSKHINPIAKTFAWCLMPNHFHLLVKIHPEEVLAETFSKFKTLEKLKGEHRLSKQFANLFSSYTQAFNKVYDRRGSLFLKNFKRIEVEDRTYLKNLILYIHLNPTKHGFSSGAESWPWSSYHTFRLDYPKLKDGLFGDDTIYYAEHAHKKLALETYLNIESSIGT